MREKEERKKEKRKIESERERGRERGERGSSSRDEIISIARGIVERGGEKEENKREREREKKFFSRLNNFRRERDRGKKGRLLLPPLLVEREGGSATWPLTCHFRASLKHKNDGQKKL